MKGGYKIIDFKNVSLSGTPVTMTDVLVDLLNNYEKVVLLSHVVLSGSVKDDCFSTVLSDGEGGVKLNCYDGYISINSSGAVTYTVASASGMASDIAELNAEIGDIDDLETTEKESVVGAVNELVSNLDTIKSYRGLMNNISRDNTLDANNIKETSIFFSGTSSTNLPADYTFLITLGNGDNIKQIAIPLSYTSYSIWIRTYRPNSGTWSEWAKTN